MEVKWKVKKNQRVMALENRSAWNSSIESSYRIR